jgi:hypothetical protein
VDRDTAPLPRAIQPSNPLAATRLNQGMRASPLADSGGPSYAAADALRSGAASLRTTLPRAACTAGRRFFPEGSIRIAATMTFTPSHFPTEQRSPRERWRAGWQVTAPDREQPSSLSIQRDSRVSIGNTGSTDV